jgi:hypothetical protein
LLGILRVPHLYVKQLISVYKGCMVPFSKEAPS